MLRATPLRPAAGGARSEERRGHSKRKKQGVVSSPSAASLQLIPPQVLHQRQRCVLHDARPPVLGGVGSDELPSFPFDSGFALNVSPESLSLSLSAEQRVDAVNK